MQLKLFNAPVTSQLTRLFGSTTYDNKSAYLVALASGKTTKDLNQCLNYHVNTGAGFFFDTARLASTGIGTLLGTSSDCTRSIGNNILSCSEINITATAQGKPTHIVLGGIVPVCLEIGTDVDLLYPGSNSVVDVTATGSVVYCPAFDIALSGISGMAPWLMGNEVFAVDSSVFTAGSAFGDYAGNSWNGTAGTTVSPTDGIGYNSAVYAATTTPITSVNVAQSFTLDFKYRQSSTAKFADIAFFYLYSSNTVRWAIGFEPANNQLAIWNNAASAKVIRAIDKFAAMKSTTFVQFKYVYDATTNLHRIYIDGTLIDSFTYVNVQPATTVHRLGMSGAFDSAVIPYFDNIRVRQGVFL